VPGDTLAETERGEDAEPAREALLAMLPFLSKAGEFGPGELLEDRVVGIFLGAIELA
jgi:hypothetical protein